MPSSDHTLDVIWHIRTTLHQDNSQLYWSWWVVLFCGSGPSGGVVLVGNSPRDHGPVRQWMDLSGGELSLVGSCPRTVIWAINWLRWAKKSIRGWLHFIYETGAEDGTYSINKLCYLDACILESLIERGWDGWVIAVLQVLDIVGQVSSQHQQSQVWCFNAIIANITF